MTNHKKARLLANIAKVSMINCEVESRSCLRTTTYTNEASTSRLKPEYAYIRRGEPSGFPPGRISITDHKRSDVPQTKRAAHRNFQLVEYQRRVRAAYKAGIAAINGKDEAIKLA
jgi:hypothetical protein